MQGTLSLAAWLPARTVYGYRGMPVYSSPHMQNVRARSQADVFYTHSLCVPKNLRLVWPLS